MKCEVIEQDVQQVVSVRTRTSVEKMPQVLGEVYGKIINYLKEIGQKPLDYAFTAYYNMDMQDLDIEVGFPVSTPVKGKDDIKPNTIPAGKYAVCLHKGAYNKLESSYHSLMAWVKEQNISISGIAYEFYLNDPSNTPEEELETRIAFPME